jgi:hypothetical protein
MVLADGQTIAPAINVIRVSQPLEITSLRGGLLRTADFTTVLKIEPLKPFAIGEHPVVVAHLTTPSGKPIPKQLIRVFSYKNHRAQGVTDSTGPARIPLRWNFQVGTYDLHVVFIGDKTSKFTFSEAFGTLIIVPAQMTVRTVPPLAGIRFLFNNQTLVSDEKGLINIKVNKIGTYRLEVLPLEKNNSAAHVEFSRWNKEVYVPYLDVRIPSKSPIEAGFLISYPVSYQFFEPTGKLVDPTRISEMTLRAQGTTYQFKDSGPHWLPAYRLERRIGRKLELLNVNYSFQNVTIDGTNVLNQGQQRFQVSSPNDVWQVQLLLYSAHFSALDAIFHTPIGSSGVQLDYPNGLTKVIHFGQNSDLEVPSLARGLYNAKVIGATGSSPLTPLFLSRDQNVELLVISHRDMEILFGIPVLIALILLLVGRTRLLYVLWWPFSKIFQKGMKPVNIISIHPDVISDMTTPVLTADIHSNMSNPIVTEPASSSEKMAQNASATKARHRAKRRRNNVK